MFKYLSLYAVAGAILFYLFCVAFNANAGMPAR